MRVLHGLYCQDVPWTLCPTEVVVELVGLTAQVGSHPVSHSALILLDM